MWDLPWPRIEPVSPELAVPLFYFLGFPGSSEVKASACNAGDPGSIPGLGRSPGEGNGNPLQYSSLEKPGGLQSMGSQRVGYDWATSLHFTFYSTFRLNSHFYSEAEVLSKAQTLVQGCSCFLGLPKIHHHKLGALKQQKFILSILKARSLKSRCGGTTLSLMVSRDN